MTAQLWWFVARASGIVAWMLATGSILWGLALSTRALGKRPGAPWLLDLHRFLGRLTVVFVGVHLLGLFLDTYVHFGLAELFVPMASSWKPLPVAWGIVAFYFLAAVEVTSLLKRWLPKRLWHSIHFGSYGLYALATVHLITAGTDGGNAGVRMLAIVSLGTVVFFTAYRWIGPGRVGSIRAASTRRAPIREATPTADAPIAPVPSLTAASTRQNRARSRSSVTSSTARSTRSLEMDRGPAISTPTSNRDG